VAPEDFADAPGTVVVGDVAGLDLHSLDASHQLQEVAS
jgi:hypothetical protein